jgi:DnaJ-class molecular chaperone
VDNPYTTLGVKKDASAEEIRSAYRKLAKQHHPDLNPGKSDAEKRFKDVTAAYDLLSDPEKRKRFDRGEIDASGQERPERPFYRAYADSQAGAKYRTSQSSGQEDLGDLFSNIFGEGRRGRSTQPHKGEDRQYTLSVDFLDAVKGASRRLTLPDGKTLDVNIPAGITDGQTLRLRGQGAPGLRGMAPGDALVEIKVEPHPFFRRADSNIEIEVPVTVAEAVLGGNVNVPTVSGPVSMTVPKGSDTGTVLRLRGKGVPAHGKTPAGDQLVTLKVVIGPKDSELEKFLKDWAAKRPFDPRQGMAAP